MSGEATNSTSDSVRGSSHVQALGNEATSRPDEWVKIDWPGSESLSTTVDGSMLKSAISSAARSCAPSTTSSELGVSHESSRKSAMSTSWVSKMRAAELCAAVVAWNACQS